MRARSLVLAALLVSAGTALSGCVAAAIPVVAGGLVVRSETAKDQPPESAGAPTNEGASAPARGAVSVSKPGAPPAGPAPETDQLAPVAESGAATIAIVPSQSSAQPPIRPAPAQTFTMQAYDAFYDYVGTQARRDPVDSPRASALLMSPGQLSPARTDCSIRPPAVVIDLDPADAVFDPTLAYAPNLALGQMLATLRMEEIDIFWTSALPAVQAGAVRRALQGSGLDTDGKDGLLLMRNGEDRKQARRRELAQTHCLVAIAGDTRADFDELYLYLKDRSAAQPLEELVGAGWFLTPLPLQQGK